MIRIMTADGPACALITVDGQLSGENVEPVEICCNQAAGKGKPVQLFLRDVSLIDERGRALLSRLASRGIGLRAFGVYSAYVVGLIRQQQAKSRKPIA